MARLSVLTQRAGRRPLVLASLAFLACAAAILGARTLQVHKSESMARALTGGDPHNGPALLQRYGCAGCHTIPSVPGADGKVGPALDHLRARVFIADRLPNTAEHLIQFVRSPRSQVPGTAMPDTGITQSEARDVAAYLYAN